jgi:hypothetical protein
MPPSTFHEQVSTLPTLLTVIAAIALGTSVLGGVGLASWSELRRHRTRAAGGISIPAAGWGAGPNVLLARPIPLGRPGQATAPVIAGGSSAVGSWR